MYIISFIPDNTPRKVDICNFICMVVEPEVREADLQSFLSEIVGIGTGLVCLYSPCLSSK